jgi:hypothetical protein
MTWKRTPLVSATAETWFFWAKRWAPASAGTSGLIQAETTLL